MMEKVFVVVYKGNHIFYQGVQMDNGAIAAKYAKEINATERSWDMYGLKHYSDLPKETRVEIKSFIRGIKRK